MESGPKGNSEEDVTSRDLAGDTPTYYKHCLQIGVDWIGQIVCSGFSVRCYKKIQMNFLSNPIFLIYISLTRVSQVATCNCKRLRDRD